VNLEEYARSLVERSITPGLAILAGRHGKIFFQNQWGYRSLVPERETLPERTLFDCASLTKPLITAFLAAYLSQRRQLDLADPVSRFFPSLPSDITLRHLLTHTAALPAWYPFYLYGSDSLAQFPHLPRNGRPGKRVLYSCPGYILLRHIIEKASGFPLPALAGEAIFSRLQLTDTFLRVPSDRRLEAAATEKGNRWEKQLCRKNHQRAARDFPWRESVIRGETHDANSFYSGGCAGNSGLFSTASDLFVLAREFFPSTTSTFTPETLRVFWARATLGKRSPRTIGFKLNCAWQTSGGAALAAEAIGHNGFTGTSIWLEGETASVFIILSNRIHPLVKTFNFDRVRRRLHRLIKRELGWR